jgi:hypothetical protein
VYPHIKWGGEGSIIVNRLAFFNVRPVGLIEDDVNLLEAGVRAKWDWFRLSYADSNQSECLK